MHAARTGEAEDATPWDSWAVAVARKDGKFPLPPISKLLPRHRYNNFCGMVRPYITVPLHALGSTVFLKMNALSQLWNAISEEDKLLFDYSFRLWLDTRIAFAMVLHKRLGAASQWKGLPGDVIKACMPKEGY